MTRGQVYYLAENESGKAHEDVLGKIKKINFPNDSKDSDNNDDNNDFPNKITLRWSLDRHEICMSLLNGIAKISRPDRNHLTELNFTVFLHSERQKIHKVRLGESITPIMTNILASPNHSSLKSLALNRTGLGDDECISLANSLSFNKNLRNLQLAGNQIGERGASALADALRSNTCLRNLCLNSNPIGNAGCARISNVISNGVNNTLTTLSLKTCGIGFEGAQALANALSCSNDENSNKEESKMGLRTLAINSNFIGDDGCIAISNSLVQNKSLRTLSMNNCGIGLNGVEALANALRQHQTPSFLQTLHLSDSGIGNNGCVVLCDALVVNKSLQHLCLHDCRIGAEGAIALSNVLRKPNDSSDNSNSTGDCGLVELSLYGNRIQDRGLLALADSLRGNNNKNNKLEMLGLSAWNNKTFKEQSWHALLDALRTNHILKDLGTKWKAARSVHEHEINEQLQLNSTKPIRAETIKTGLFPHCRVYSEKDLSLQCSVGALAKVVDFGSLSGLYSFVREYPAALPFH